MQRGDLAGAVAVLREATRLKPDSAEARYNLGVALKQQDDFAAAEVELRRATELDPSLQEAFYTLGVVLWQTGRAEDAVQAFRSAINRRPDYADAHYMLGTILRQQGLTSEALAAFRATIANRPTSAEAHLSLGQLLAQLGQTEASVAALAEAERLTRLKADREAAAFAVAVGVQKLEARDTAGAIERFREAIRLAPESARAHYQLALALQRAGAEREAQTHFAEAKRLAPFMTSPAQAVRR
jgi:tetratricopeptide (TPR) repeat protein